MEEFLKALKELVEKLSNNEKSDENFVEDNNTIAQFIKDFFK